MLRTHPPQDIVVTYGPGHLNSKYIPDDPQHESVYRMVQEDIPEPLFKSKYNGKILKSAESFPRLATDSGECPNVPKTVPVTSTGLYITPGSKSGLNERQKPVGSPGTNAVKKSKIPTRTLDRSTPTNPNPRSAPANSNPRSISANTTPRRTPIQNKARTTPPRKTPLQSRTPIKSLPKKPPTPPPASPLELLKRRHKKLEGLYMKLPIASDVPSAIRRKVGLEKELEELEREIARLNMVQ
ncbi:uncharacterized protein SPPG_08146 [Spizellomyces punctatus DAOM BR117]|uniref:Enkurin domain-containing protein n=1 Tax=Spizellomyces punctatus (strain DAOM BR117) TaxID=645134 RepID=A0A0L0H6H3_SPIPD|nr:uncharacterized protein SPPG_08146 [Spizellomyces punctatus DAOM BR117]KNC96559.1 hypothetical protein SPPG_08146 [Spizellomyces punctatus DAOM BR117]|eukprot:XP_016604599.1 hypothetical protein SPPG_08146 [Spizellomyces punctatus DAOM BR117]